MMTLGLALGFFGLSCGGTSSNTACGRDPQGAQCQTCLKDARIACVNRGICSTQYDTLEACNVRVANGMCVDSAGNPATNCCTGPSDTFSSCLDAQCAEWNACLK